MNVSRFKFAKRAFKKGFLCLGWTVGPGVAAWLLLAVGFKGLFLFVAFTGIGFLLLQVSGKQPITSYHSIDKEGLSS